MKLKVYKDIKQPKTQYFKLKESSEGLILSAVDRDGEHISHGHILKLTSGGIMLCSDINKDLGLSLDGNGYIKTVIYD